MKTILLASAAILAFSSPAWAATVSSSAHATSAKSTGGTSVKTAIKTTPVVHHVPTPPVVHVKVRTPPVVHHVPTPPVVHVKVRPPPKPPPPPPKKPAYKYGDPIPTDAPPLGQSLFPAGLTAPYALSLGPRTAFWGPAPGKQRDGLINPFGPLGGAANFRIACPCFIVRDEFNRKIWGGVPADLNTLHIFEGGVADTRFFNATGIPEGGGTFSFRLEGAILGAVWGSNYNPMAPAKFQPIVRADQGDPFRLPDNTTASSSPPDLSSPSDAAPYDDSSQVRAAVPLPNLLSPDFPDGDAI